MYSARVTLEGVHSTCRHSTDREVALMILMAYLSYVMASALRLPIHRLVQAADSVSAKILRKTLGGGMQQIGVLCAAASVDKKILLSWKAITETLRFWQVYCHILKGSKISRTKLCNTLEQHGVLVLPEEVINKVREQCSSVPALKVKRLSVYYLLFRCSRSVISSSFHNANRKTRGQDILWIRNTISSYSGHF
ncbi:hypothetical protein CQW23_11024 [Capsicum baccatum]|uniref:Uncharacterized protein n=1 Tax=Capsicum baccatum TaxID=33114 RepID=A0A2G2X1B0_CAPBA|nr:hypothetical protein CQW23_11024 [Capsicum baccatum]